jgi:hypothetical protein
MNIKPFDEFFEASDEFRLMKDLEDLGAKERTWTKEQVRSALEDVNWAGSFSGELVDPDNFEYTFDERRVEVLAQFMGGYVGEFDVREVWGVVQDSLLKMKMDKDADEDEKFYTMDEIEKAFDYTDYEKLATKFIEDSNFYDSVEIDIEGRDRGNGELSISASATFDDDNIEIDEDEIMDEILGNL